MIIAGKYYAPNKSAMLDTLFNPINGRTANGYYRRVKHGIRLYNVQGTLFAYIAMHEARPFIVSASTLDNGKVWYMQGLSSLDREYMGLDKLGYTQTREEIERATNELKAYLEVIQ